MEFIKDHRFLFVVIGILLIALVGVLWAWLDTRNNLEQVLERAEEDFGTYEERLAICDDAESVEEKDACRKVLLEISADIAEYQAQIADAVAEEI